MNKNKLVPALLISAALIAVIVGYLKINDKKPLRYLPYFGIQRVDTILKSGMYTKDTVFHTVQDFNFVNQDGKNVSQKDFDGSIYVTDFFFTTCQSICPIMSKEMEKVAAAYKGNSKVKILSHTVNPEFDSVPVLKAYAQQHNADVKQWMFVTGNKQELYAIARTGYYLNAEQGDGGPEDFIHTQNFALVDMEKHLRGYYDGTKPEEVDQLIKDIALLLKEYDYKQGLNKN
jgi:protein SCO1/2